MSSGGRELCLHPAVVIVDGCDDGGGGGVWGDDEADDDDDVTGLHDTATVNSFISYVQAAPMNQQSLWP